MNRDGCPSGYKLKDGECIPKNHRELAEGETFHGIYNYKESHWGKGQTGISLCLDGSFDVSKNKPEYTGEKGYISSWEDDTGLSFPTHRTLKTHGCYPAIYSFAWPADHPGGTIWLYPYPDAKKNVDNLKKAMCNFMGKYGSSEETKVKSNTSRELLFKLGDICK
jgi:hypothetical protein